MNLVVVCGALAESPQERTLASGERLVTMELRVAGDDGRGTTSVPLAWFGAPEPAGLEAGTEVLVVGAVRRRYFRAAGGTQSRTDVVVRTLVPTADRRRSRRALAAAADALGPVRSAR